jgi:hypothetical protein
MGFGLVMQPLFRIFCEEHPESFGMIERFCFRDAYDSLHLLGRLGLSWNDFTRRVGTDGRLPHDTALRLLAEVEARQLPSELMGEKRYALMEKREQLLALLRLYRDWQEHPETIPRQMKDILRGQAVGKIGCVAELTERPWLELG